MKIISPGRSDRGGDKIGPKLHLTWAAAAVATATGHYYCLHNNALPFLIGGEADNKEVERKSRGGDERREL